MLALLQTQRVCSIMMPRHDRYMQPQPSRRRGHDDNNNIEAQASTAFQERCSAE